MPRRPPFDGVADAYDRVRPGYPDAAVDDVVAFSALPKRGRVLEIGAGTGQLSVALAERGYELTAVELGPHLAERLAANLSEYASCEVISGDFHAADLVERSYDLVVAATSFHWLDRAEAFDKAATLLRPTGALGLLFNVQVHAADGFDGDADAVYQEHAPEIGGSGPSLTAFQQIDWVAEIAATGSYGEVRSATHRWSTCFSRSAYLELLSTHSDHIGLDAEARSRLFAGLGALIDQRYGGQVEQVYDTLVLVAPRQAGRER